MIIDENSIEESSEVSEFSDVSQSSKEDIVINKVHIVISEVFDLDYLENNYILSDYKENLIEV